MNIPDRIFDRAIKEGFTKEAACALLANIQAESAFIVNNLEDSKERPTGMNDQSYTDAVDSGRYQNFVNDACGYGLAQWTYWPRKQMMLNYAREQGKSIGSFEMQKEFIFYEMKLNFSGIYNACRTSHDLEYLVHEFLYKWENPAEKENNMQNRLASARGFYQKYAVWENKDEEEEKMTKEQAIQKVLNLARAEIGYHEKNLNAGLDDNNANAGSGNYTKYARDLDKMTNWYNGAKNGFAWCEVFVDWLFYKCFGDPLGREMICQPSESAGAGCLYSAQYYKQAGNWFNTPEVGDQIFFTYAAGEYSHTGIVERAENGMVTTIEGNTSDQVARRQYMIGSSNIAGYGRPKWELVTGNTSSAIAPGASANNETGAIGGMLRKGTVGGDVKEMQQKLLKLGYDLGPDGADGDFGVNTEAAVRKFQSDYQLEVDGIVGPETMKKLNELQNGSNTSNQTMLEAERANANIEEPVPYIGVNELRLGHKGNQVKLAQAALSCLGYTISIDGMFGNEFEKKIKEFQSANGIQPNGVIGKNTWSKLFEIPFRASGNGGR